MKIHLSRRASMGVFFLLVLGACQALPAQNSILETTVSSLVDNPQSFNGEVVSFKAFAITSMHATMLYDENSGEKGIALSIPSSLEGDVVVNKVVDESFSPEVATGKRRIWVTFKGKIEWNREAKPGIVLLLMDANESP